MLIRTLGLLVNQAGVYGPVHNVTQSAARSVFTELERALKTFGPIELATRDGQVLVNGAGENYGVAPGKNLYDRMCLYKIGGLLFVPPLDQREFMVCVNLFGTPPQTLATNGGFEAVLKRSGLRSIRVVSVAYQRVSGDEPAVASDKSKSHFFSAEPVAVRIEEPVKPARPAMLDLSAALAGSAPLGSTASPELPESAPESPSTLSRRQRSAALAAMLRDAAAALERDQGSEVPQTEMSGTLDKIREALSEMAAGSRRDISTLASQVDEDSKTIASIESAARRRGIGLKLTRGELVQRYAELNQEIVQPLTVSSGVIDLLSSGKAGDLSESQLELLKMASESVDRVNQLVSHMSSICGLPESYTPNREVISDSYR